MLHLVQRIGWRISAVALLLSAGGMSASATAQCVGDCNNSGTVTVDKLIVAVNIALGMAPLTACQSLDVDHNGMVSINELVQAVDNALQGCPIVGMTPTPTPVPSPREYVYWDQDEEEDVIAPGGQPVQLVLPWDPNGQMCIFPDSSGRPGEFVVGYDPTLPAQHNLGGLLPYHEPPIGLAVWDRYGEFTGQTIYVPGPFVLEGQTIGGDVPPDNSSLSCTDGHTATCKTDADCDPGTHCVGNYNNNGTFTGCAFDSKADLFAADLGQAQGAVLPPDQGRIIEWFPPDYTQYCIIYGPTQGGVGQHHVNGTGGIRQPGLMAIDSNDNLYIPAFEASPTLSHPGVLKFDHSVLPTGPQDCGPNGLQTPPAQPTVFINAVAPANVQGIAVPQGIALDPTCSTSTSNCWAVTNVTSGTTIGQDTDAVYWFDDSGQPKADKGPLPKGNYNPLGIAISATGDVYFISIGLSCNGTDCNTVDDGGGLFKATLSNGTFSSPVQLAFGLDFPTSVTICNADTQTCPEPVTSNTPTVQPTQGSGGG